MFQSHCQSLLQQLLGRHSGVITEPLVEEVVTALDAVPVTAPYHALPTSVSNAWGRAEANAGEKGRDALRRATLVWLIARFDERAASLHYTEPVRERFKHSFARILALAARELPEEYAGESDLYLKDLALCRQQSFPAGAQMVERDSGFPRSLMIRKGPGQAFAFTRFLLGPGGGHRHYYQIHTHLLEMEDFTPEGWDACYIRIAGMLKLNESVRGMWGGSWFYDPALAEVSPNLAYLRERPMQNGAFLFFSEVSVESGALAKSKTRKRLYDEGKYLPRSYALIWPREAMIAWADRFGRGRD